MVHLYVDVEGLLTNDIRLKDGEVRDFMLGFTQAQPLFMIVDVGHDPEKLSRKVEGTSDCSWFGVSNSRHCVEIRVLSHVSAMSYGHVGHITPIEWGQRHPPAVF